jgi:predicted glycosyltransferase
MSLDARRPRLHYGNTSMTKKIWIDLDNSPHVPLFRPIIRELHARNIETVITARDYAQTKKLLQLWEIPHQLIGTHGGRDKAKKILNLFMRSNKLRQYVKDKSIDLALSHGSRTQLVAARMLGMPSILMLDYEYTETRIFNYLSSYLLIPEYIPDARLRSARINTGKVLRYPGFKEQLYLNDFLPDPDFRKRLGIGEDKILMTIRPPAMEGNYHDSLSDAILLEILGRATSNERVYPLIVSRTGKDRGFLLEHFAGNIHFLEKAVDGLQLIWNSDLFISGGGSMNRESALLGVPTYSIFTGRKPYLDEYLSEQGRLTFIDTREKIDLLEISKREITGAFSSKNEGLVAKVVDIVLST